MPVKIRYTGTTSPYFAPPSTGVFEAWRPGVLMEVPDAAAPVMVALGVFAVDGPGADSPGATQQSAAWATDSLGNPIGMGGPGGASIVGSIISVGASRALTAADNGNTLECTAAGIALTIPSGVLLTLGVVVIPNGATTVVSSGGTLLNGATSTVTRDATLNAAFAVIPRTAANSYVVTGN